MTSTLNMPFSFVSFECCLLSCREARGKWSPHASWVRRGACTICTSAVHLWVRKDRHRLARAFCHPIHWQSVFCVPRRRRCLRHSVKAGPLDQNGVGELLHLLTRRVCVFLSSHFGYPHARRFPVVPRGLQQRAPCEDICGRCAYELNQHRGPRSTTFVLWDVSVGRRRGPVLQARVNRISIFCHCLPGDVFCAAVCNRCRRLVHVVVMRPALLHGRARCEPPLPVRLRSLTSWFRFAVMC